MYDPSEEDEEDLIPTENNINNSDGDYIQPKDDEDQEDIIMTDEDKHDTIIVDSSDSDDDMKKADSDSDDDMKKADSDSDDDMKKADSDSDDDMKKADTKDAEELMQEIMRDNYDDSLLRYDISPRAPFENLQDLEFNLASIEDEPQPMFPEELPLDDYDIDSFMYGTQGYSDDEFLNFSL